LQCTLVPRSCPHASLGCTFSAPTATVDLHLLINCPFADTACPRGGADCGGEGKGIYHRSEGHLHCPVCTMHQCVRLIASATAADSLNCEADFPRSLSLRCSAPTDVLSPTAPPAAPSPCSRATPPTVATLKPLSKPLKTTSNSLNRIKLAGSRRSARRRRRLCSWRERQVRIGWWSWRTRVGGER
jgi:hypothetical protein